MTIRVQGVIGGPKRRRIIRPRMIPGFFPKNPRPSVVIEKSKPPKQEVEAFVISSQDEETTHLPVEVTEEVSEVTLKPEAIIETPRVITEEVDPIEEEDKNPSVDSMFPATPEYELKCDICGFISKSARGLKSHKRWKHSTVSA